MAELADAPDLGSGGNTVGVQVMSDILAQALLVELADTYGLGPYALRCKGSSPLEGTTNTLEFQDSGVFFYGEMLNEN